MAPDQFSQAGHGDRAPPAHAKPCGGNVDEQYPNRIALQPLSRGAEQTPAEGSQRHDYPCQQQGYCQDARKAQKTGRIGKAVHEPSDQKNLRHALAAAELRGKRQVA